MCASALVACGEDANDSGTSGRADQAVDPLDDVEFRGEATDEERAAAGSVLRLYQAADKRECDRLVTPQVRSVCASTVPFGQAAPEEVEDVTIYESGTCALVVVGFSDGGTKRWNTEKNDERWAVGVSDDFGDDTAETCVNAEGTAEAARPGGTTLTGGLELIRDEYLVASGEASIELISSPNALSELQVGDEAGTFDLLFPPTTDPEFAGYTCVGRLVVEEPETPRGAVLAGELEEGDESSCGSDLLFEVEGEPDGGAEILVYEGDIGSGEDPLYRLLSLGPE